MSRIFRVRMRTFLASCLAASLLLSEGHAQRRPRILIDNSKTTIPWMASPESWLASAEVWKASPLEEFNPAGYMEYQRLYRYLTRRGDMVRFPSSRPQTERLKNYLITSEMLSGNDLVVRIEATPEQARSEAYSAAEIDAYKQYVANGGSLLLLQDYVRPNQRDQLAEAFGIRFMGISRGENRIDRLVPHPITQGVTALSYGNIPEYDPERGGGSGVVALTAEKATLLAFLSERTYLDLNFDRRHDPANEPVGSGVLGVIEFGRGVIVFMGDRNTALQAHQPLTENIFDFLLAPRQ